jgi:hypothetical protein
VPHHSRNFDLFKLFVLGRPGNLDRTFLAATDAWLRQQGLNWNRQKLPAKGKFPGLSDDHKGYLSHFIILSPVHCLRGPLSRPFHVLHPCHREGLRILPDLDLGVSSAVWRVTTKSLLSRSFRQTAKSGQSGAVTGIHSFMHRNRARDLIQKANSLATCLSTAAIIVVYASIDPLPASDHFRADPVSLASIDFAIDDSAVPLPLEIENPLSQAAHAPLPDAPEVQADNHDEQNEGQVADGAPAAKSPSPAQVTDGIILSQQEAVQYSLFLLENGEAQLKQIPWYSAVFSKHERINGDLQESQTIDIKVRQSPAFSVYMKWRNGDTGRQALYSDEYEDRQMVVKLGGLKGRLLPGIKLDPEGERAMAESRYPITRAGLLGMQQQIIKHRREDVARGHGVRCRRLPDQLYDDTQCLCFEFIYESQEISPVYRKSLMLIDARRHIAMLTRSYTWANEADSLTTEQLDAQTLIEDYSFSSINFGAELVAEDFSRDNPRYRM